ncbi:MAG TPA: hypothetical protein VMF03_06015 [Steroidobacteraceae bacterium]|nr:hypothetical protein [Steroidobacteraceae bacterium]
MPESDFDPQPTRPLPPGPPQSPGYQMLGRVNKFYSLRVVGILCSLWTYLCALGVAMVAPRYLAPDTRNFVVVVLPLLTGVLVVGIIFMAYVASDEYVRRRILRCAALTGVIVAFSTLGYFCLEMLGYARLSMIVVNLYGWAVFTALLMWILYRAR